VNQQHKKALPIICFFISAVTSLDLDEYKRTTLKWNSEKQDEGMVDWIHLAHDRDQWLTLTKMLPDRRVP
jgi:hypothetical protein